MKKKSRVPIALHSAGENSFRCNRQEAKKRLQTGDLLSLLHAVVADSTATKRRSSPPMPSKSFIYGVLFAF